MQVRKCHVNVASRSCRCAGAMRMSGLKLEMNTQVHRCHANVASRSCRCAGAIRMSRLKPELNMNVSGGRATFAL
eukprot:365420-Chlamydomonas_euryale.AAC.2